MAEKPSTTKPPKHNSAGIRETKRYIDPEGREIIAFFRLDGSLDFIKGSITVKVGDKTILLDWKYPSKTTIEKAFSAFDDYASDKLEKLKADLAKSAESSQ